MPRCNPENERAKREYLRYLREARGRSDKTLDKVSADLDRFETFTNRKDFKCFRIEQAEEFKRVLCEQPNKRTGKALSKSTVLHVVGTLRDFFRWLPSQRGYKSLRSCDADYFNLPARDVRIAQTTKSKRVPTLHQILHVLACSPTNSDIERRDQALIALTLATGARDGAIASLKVKHIDVVERKLVQDAREVNTKAAKTFETWFFPVGDEVLQIIARWVHFLIREKLFGPDDPLFPATKVGLVDRRFAPVGLSRSHWISTTPIRKLFKTAFERVKLPYCNPHSFRSTLGSLGERRCRTPEEFKAWSQNLGHESPLTTFTSYGRVEPERQAQVIRELGRRRVEGPSSTIDLADLLVFVKKQTRQELAITEGSAVADI